MKTFLHHLNQSLHDTNKTIWNEWLRPSLVYIIFGIFLIAFSLIPVIFVDNETFFYAWPIFGIIFSSLCFIIYLVYDNSQRKKTSEPEVVFQAEYNGFSVIKEPSETAPLTIKESVNHGLWWTGYIFSIIFSGILFVSAWALIHQIKAEPLNIAAACLSDFPDTSEGRIAFDQATDVWVKRYIEANPLASFETMLEARNTSWSETGCTIASEENICPNAETFVREFNNWSIEFLDANPGYAEKEQREGWQKHLEDMGCIESQSIIDNAIYGGTTEDYE